MVVLAVLIGATYGVLLGVQRRFRWPARILLMSTTLAALVLASDRILNEDHDTAQPWLSGMMTGTAVLTVMNVWQLIQHLRDPGHPC